MSKTDNVCRTIKSIPIVLTIFVGIVVMIGPRSMVDGNQVNSAPSPSDSFPTKISPADDGGESAAALSIANSTSTGEMTQAQIVKEYGRLPLSFEENLGQTDPEVRFLSRGKGYTLFLTPTGAVLSLRKPFQPVTRNAPTTRKVGMGEQSNSPVTKAIRSVLRMKLVGANRSPLIEGREEKPGKSNYFIGNDPSKWRADVDHYAKVLYRDVYPGIDLIYYGNQGQLEFDFALAPGASPKTIRLAFTGAKKARIDARGDLLLTTSAGQVRQQRPVVYQETGGIKKVIPARYVITAGRQVGFQVAAYDTSKRLIIDPVLVYSTFLGGNNDEEGRSVAVDSSGNAYVTGVTESINFPTTPGAFDTTHNGLPQVYVTKLSALGTSLIYSTYLGNGEGYSVAVDAAGNAYVAGVTGSDSFPTTPGAYDTTYNGGGDGFLAKLAPSGSSLTYATYLGGLDIEHLYDLAVDSTGAVCVTGLTTSPSFPITPGAYQSEFRGGREEPCVFGDAFVTKLNAAGTALIYSTFLGGSKGEVGFGIALDAAGNAYVAGGTESTNFPITSGAFQTTFASVNCPPSCFFACEDGFVAKLNASGTALIYSTYLGGASTDTAWDVAINSSGSAIVTGSTSSGNFPVANPIQSTRGGQNDAFVTSLNLDGSGLIYSTFLGGSGGDQGNAIALDSSDNAYVIGSTSSTNFPTVNPLQPVLGGDFDAFVTKINAVGSALVYSTYLGGALREGVLYASIAVDIAGEAYATGTTYSPNFPRTPGAFQTTFGGDNSGSFPKDAFIVKITGSDSCLQLSRYNQAFAAAGGGDSFSILAPGGCSWAVLSNDSWITITSGNGGGGNGLVSYTVTASDSLNPRVGTITIGGLIFTITQAGWANCTYNLSPTNQSFPGGGGSGSITVTTQIGCVWMAVNNTPSWIGITSSEEGRGSGTVGFIVTANDTVYSRTGTITISGQTFTVTQTADTDSDGIPDVIEIAEDRNPFVRDNDIFQSARLFVMQQYRDFLGREGDAGGIVFWTNQITSGAQTRVQMIDTFFTSTEFSAVNPVARLYFAYFLRIPDYGGLNFWVNQYRGGMTLNAISQAFAQSPEFINRYGSLTNSQFVELVYQNVLGRAADAGGLAYWTGQLDSGAMTRGQVMLAFSESAENLATSFNKVFVVQIYVGMLRRSPEQGGFDFWVGALNGGGSRLQLIEAFLGSLEYRLRFLPPIDTISIFTNEAEFNALVNPNRTAANKLCIE